MERSTFKVDTQLLVNSEGRQVFVPVSLLALKLKPVNEVIGLEYQPPAPGYSSSGKSKKRLPWEAQKVNLDHYYMVTDKPEGQQIFAHATAICRHKKDGASPLGEDIVQHSMDDQFFFEDTLKGQETLYARRDPRVQVFSLSTAEIGFVNATCLLFFPHYKVAKSFKWGEFLLRSPCLIHFDPLLLLLYAKPPFLNVQTLQIVAKLKIKSAILSRLGRDHGS